jgi:hypothetical protein
MFDRCTVLWLDIELVVLQVDEMSSVAVSADMYDKDETGPFAAVKQSVLAGIAVGAGA